jgi:peroxiredoxin
MRLLLVGVIFLGIGFSAAAQDLPGVAVGKSAPTFQARDQFGKEQTISSLMGRNGLVLVFFRSADWWPFCKQQLVQLQNAREKFQRQGLGLAALSYDSEAILEDFTQRHSIEYSLIADPKSEIIRRYGVLNANAPGFTKNMAYPGYFYVTPNGIIKEKFFEAAYTDRETGTSLLLKLFPDLVEGNGREVAAPNIKLALLQSDEIVGPGSRFTVAAEISLPPGTHVYAPGVHGYKPIQLTMEASPDFKLLPLRYPDPRVLFLPVINEAVPVYEGKFRVQQDVVVSADRAFIGSIAQPKTVTLKGIFFYQACDSVKCYLPQKSEVSWDVRVIPLDRERSPEPIQHK